MPVGQTVPEVETGDNGGLARAASIVCNAEMGRRCQRAGGQSNDYAGVVVDAGANKGVALARRRSLVEALNPAMAGQGLMFARGGTRSVEKSCGATDRWTDQERLDVGLDRTHTPPCAPGSALQKSTGRFVTCAEKIRDV